jgi:hypothetical protein
LQPAWSVEDAERVKPLDQQDEVPFTQHHRLGGPDIGGSPDPQRSGTSRMSASAAIAYLPRAGESLGALCRRVAQQRHALSSERPGGMASENNWLPMARGDRWRP